MGRDQAQVHKHYMCDMHSSPLTIGSDLNWDMCAVQLSELNVFANNLHVLRQLYAAFNGDSAVHCLYYSVITQELLASHALETPGLDF